MKFETFGDSLTEGENGAGTEPTFVDPLNSYPTKLLALLETNFPGQGITVLNQGVSGELVDKTHDKIAPILNRDRPQAVLLLSGYNDLNPCGQGQANSAACGDATQHVAFGVRDCIREAKESPVGVKYIFVSTLTPPGPLGPRRLDRNAIIETNRKITPDGRAGESHPGRHLPVVHRPRGRVHVSVDGLHLNPAGYQAIADAFFAAIKATVPQTPLPSIR